MSLDFSMCRGDANMIFVSWHVAVNNTTQIPSDAVNIQVSDTWGEFRLPFVVWLRNIAIIVLAHINAQSVETVHSHWLRKYIHTELFRSRTLERLPSEGYDVTAEESNGKVESVLHRLKYLTVMKYAGQSTSISSMVFQVLLPSACQYPSPSP